MPTPTHGHGLRVAGKRRRQGLWVAVGIALVLLQGLLGHRVSWFSGDLAYHVGVSRTIGPHDLNGSGPYAGLPSYYGGLLTLALASARLFAVSPEVALSVLSWFEPLGWLAALAYFARSLWPRDGVVRTVFLALALLGVGWGHGLLAVGVNGPNVASQVFWPLYPRDLALMATLVATGAALRGGWWLAGLACGAAVAAEAQIAVLTVLLTLVALGLDRGGQRWRRMVLSQLVAAVVSAWWWAPRILWTLRYGANPDARGFTSDLPHTAGAGLAAFGLAAVAALVGAGLVVRGWRSPTAGLMLVWSALAAVLVVLSVLAPSELLTLRRALLVGSIPVAALSAEAIAWTARHVPTQRVPWVAAAISLVVLASSLPTWLETRGTVRSAFTAQVAARFAYPDRDWDPLWEQLRGQAGAVLAPPRDAAVVWFRTGRPVTWAQLPGYVKTWFDIGRATRWSDGARREATQAAYLNQRRAACSALRRGRAHTVLFRSEPGYLGVLDLSGSAGLERFLTGRNVNAPTDQVNVLGKGSVHFNRFLLHGIDRLQVWQPGVLDRPLMVVSAGSSMLQPTGRRDDGGLTRFDYTLPSGFQGKVRFSPEVGHMMSLVRIVGLARSDLADAGPAVLVSARRFC